LPDLVSIHPNLSTMTRIFRVAAAAAALLLALAAPAAAQQPTALAAPSWDARLTPPPTAPAESVRLSAALPRPVAGVGLILLGSGLMYVTKQAEGEDGEDGVPFIPLLSGTMGAMTFWYGVYKLAVER
jgi:hypothetical protein